MERFRGNVIWFCASKGFGFIQRVGGPDVFLALNALRKTEIDGVRDGVAVEFDVSGPDGLQADNVVLV